MEYAVYLAQQAGIATRWKARWPARAKTLGCIPGLGRCVNLAGRALPEALLRSVDRISISAIVSAVDRPALAYEACTRRLAG